MLVIWTCYFRKENENTVVMTCEKPLAQHEKANLRGIETGAVPAAVSYLEQQLAVLALYELPSSLAMAPQSEGNGGLHTPRKEAKGTFLCDIYSTNG